MVRGGDGHGLILNNFLEGFNTFLSWFDFCGCNSGIYFGLSGRSAKISDGFMIFVEFTMALGHVRLNSIGAIKI